MDLTPNSLRKLRAYHWPGNVRELQNVIERAMIVSAGSILNFDGILPEPEVVVPTPEPTTPRTAGELRELERANILQALERSKWKISGEAGAARMLELAPSTLASRMKALGIRRPR
jgi:transcriptional regulator with GAF, ATPase, and Fis domain